MKSPSIGDRDTEEAGGQGERIKGLGLVLMLRVGV